MVSTKPPALSHEVSFCLHHGLPALTGILIREPLCLLSCGSGDRVNSASGIAQNVYTDSPPLPSLSTSGFVILKPFPPSMLGRCPNKHGFSNTQGSWHWTSAPALQTPEQRAALARGIWIQVLHLAGSRLLLSLPLVTTVTQAEEAVVKISLKSQFTSSGCLCLRKQLLANLSRENCSQKVDSA